MFDKQDVLHIKKSLGRRRALIQEVSIAIMYYYNHTIVTTHPCAMFIYLMN